MMIYSLACRQNHQSGMANNMRGMENSKAFFKNDRVHNTTKFLLEVCFPIIMSCNHSICINPEKILRCQFKIETENISGQEIQF